MPSAEARGARSTPRAVLPQRQLREAIAAGDVELHYQPIVELASGRIASVEALLRMRSESGTLLMPDDFLPAVAHAPVMHEVTAWVIARACMEAAAFAPAGVAVNVAAVDVVRPSLVTAVRDGLEASGLPPERLTIELTEHAAVQGMGQAVAVLEQLRGLGVELSLDDFGTGYSSLLYLRDLPVTQVKIDRTFVAGIDTNDDDAAIVRSVIQLAHRVGLTVVAEGVERIDQLRFLRTAQCDHVQGYLLAMPVPCGELPRDVDRTLTAVPSRGTGRPSPAGWSLSPRVEDTIRRLAGQGASLHTIAAALNRDGTETPTGTRWTAATVARALPPV